MGQEFQLVEIQVLGGHEPIFDALDGRIPQPDAVAAWRDIALWGAQRPGVSPLEKALGHDRRSADDLFTGMTFASGSASQ